MALKFFRRNVPKCYKMNKLFHRTFFSAMRYGILQFPQEKARASAGAAVKSKEGKRKNSKEEKTNKN